MMKDLVELIPEIIYYIPGRALVYNSVFFIILFTVFYIIYSFSLKTIKLRNILLLLFSLYFYYKISGLYVLLLIMMATSDFFIGKMIFNSKSEKLKTLLLILSIIVNAGSLFYFKYADFFNSIRVDVHNSLFGTNLTATLPEWLDFVMPVGISFYMFKTLSYIFDIKREIIEKPEKNYLNYLLYVSFFPNIMAGPISRARDLLPQFNKKIVIDKIKAGQGLFLIMCGLFKKIVIADFLGNNIVDRVFDSPEFFTNFETIVAAYSYTMQLYFDFSGYTDIVIGIALLLGFHLESNFNKPFSAKNITEFWRRWHITLSSWLNEYIFYPLSLSLRRFKTTGVVAAVIITFFISGVWHGPDLKYVIWGVLHGLALAWDAISYKARKKINSAKNKYFYNIFSVFLTFHFLVLSMIIFRADNLSKSKEIFQKIFAVPETDLILKWVELYSLPLAVLILAFLINFLPIKWIEEMKHKFTLSAWPVKVLVIFLVVLIILQVYNSESQAFIYLQY